MIFSIILCRMLFVVFLSRQTLVVLIISVNIEKVSSPDLLKPNFNSRICWSIANVWSHRQIKIVVFECQHIACDMEVNVRSTWDITVALTTDLSRDQRQVISLVATDRGKCHSAIKIHLIGHCPSSTSIQAIWLVDERKKRYSNWPIRESRL